MWNSLSASLPSTLRSSCRRWHAFARVSPRSPCLRVVFCCLLVLLSQSTQQAVPVRRVRSGLSVSRRQSSQQAAGLRRSLPSCLPLVGSFVVPNLLQEVHGVVRVTVWRVTSVVGFSEPNNTSSSPVSANSAPPLHCNLHDVALLAQVTNTEMLYSPVRSGGTAGTAAAQSQGPSE